MGSVFESGPIIPDHAPAGYLAPTRLPTAASVSKRGRLPAATRVAKLADMDPSETNPNVVDVTAESFEAGVIERSRSVTVVVDFWATWCAPCRTLGPVLEKLAGEFVGRFVLARANTEEVPEAAAQFGVRSIPAVYAVRDGRVVDSFVGDAPESAVRAWISGVLPTPAEEALGDALKLEPENPGAAEARFRDALALEANNPTARTGLARVLLKQGKAGEARTLLASLEARGFLEPEAEALKAELTLRERGEGSGGVDPARAALAQAPGDPALRLTLAGALAASGGYAEALELALGLVEEHRKDVSPDAKQLMLDVFRLLPADSDLTAEYRRKLSAALY